MKHDYYEKKDKSLAAGIGALFSSFLSMGGGALIYVFLLHDKENNIVDELLLWFGAATFSLVGVYLLIHSLSIVIQNIIFMKKGIPRPKSENAVFVNTDPQAGVLAFVISFVFILAIIFFLFPMYKKAEVELAMLLVFVIMSIILLIYAFSVMIYNFVKRK